MICQDQDEDRFQPNKEIGLFTFYKQQERKQQSNFLSPQKNVEQRFSSPTSKLTAIAPKQLVNKGKTIQIAMKNISQKQPFQSHQMKKQQKNAQSHCKFTPRISTKIIKPETRTFRSKTEGPQLLASLQTTEIKFPQPIQLVNIKKANKEQILKIFKPAKRVVHKLSAPSQLNVQVQKQQIEIKSLKLSSVSEKTLTIQVKEVEYQHTHKNIKKSDSNKMNFLDYLYHQKDLLIEHYSGFRTKQQRKQIYHTIKEKIKKQLRPIISQTPRARIAVLQNNLIQ